MRGWLSSLYYVAQWTLYTISIFLGPTPLSINCKSCSKSKSGSSMTEDIWVYFFKSRYLLTRVHNSKMKEFTYGRRGVGQIV